MSSDAHIATFNTFLQPDPHSVGLLKLLQEIYPAFAKRLFYKNPFMQKVIMSNMNPMEILDYPICGKCETLAAWSGVVMKDGKMVRTCGCFATGCGATTVNPVTMRLWMIDELRRKAPPDIAEIAEIAVDVASAQMMKMAMRDLEKVLAKKEFDDNKRIGILKADGTEYKPDPVEQKKKKEYIESEVAKLRKQAKGAGTNNV